MDPIDKKELAEECLTIVRQLHEIGAPEETKNLNEKLLNGFPTYARFMEKDLQELVRLSMELRSLLQDLEQKNS